MLSTRLDSSAYTNTTVISQDYADKFRQLKEATAGEILLFGSPTATHSLLTEDLIDVYWLFLNPVALGAGIPVFNDVQERQLLKLLGTKVFSSGGGCMRHEVQFG